MKNKTSKLIIFVLFICLLVGIGIWLSNTFDKGYSIIKGKYPVQEQDSMSLDSSDFMLPENQ